ncbi:MAG TPA: EF-hand domain-containing protein [Thermoanaerobaculia bacterium]|nr:EF-hand domain-containing protein [Thermoanaerobaculia bacterium]
MPGILHVPLAFADEKDKDKQDKEKDHKWKGDDRGRRGAQGIPPGHLPPPGECRVGRVFDLLDVNEDGRLGRNEIRDARPRDGNRESRQERLEDRFRNSDDNRDGRLSRNEWWGREETFERLDRNNDGHLSWTEIWGRGRGSAR